MSWRERSGRGVRVAVIDSGIHAQHPHVGRIAGGATIGDGAGPTSDTADRIGHGTAVAAAIREKAPDAELYAVRIFERTLATTADRLVRAIAWAADAGAHVINLSLGTAKPEHEGRLTASVAYASQRGALLVAAAASDGVCWLPGSLAGVVAVQLDWECPRDGFRVLDAGGRRRFAASGFARPIPGVPLEANLKGISFAVANISGFVARAREHAPDATVEEIGALMGEGPQSR